MTVISATLAGERRASRSPLAAVLIGCVLWAGVTSQPALAQTPPTTSPGTGSRAAPPPPCAVEVVLEPGATPPVSTLPGTCSTSATSGTFAAPGIQFVAPGRLPATGPRPETVGLAGAIILALGLALRRAAGHPRTP